MRPVIILFAKAPIPGRVKTRLVPPLDPEQAARLHLAMVWDAIESLRQITGADLELHTDTPTDAWAAAPVAQSLQYKGDLGLKMLEALRNALANGRERAMIAGSDAPGVPLGHLEALLHSSRDLALGPCEDGGFYAISCRRVHPRMFEGVAWSAPDTLQRTMEAIEKCGLSVELGPPWFDVDTPQDLERMRSTPGLGRHTAKMIL